jgi:ATP-dependent Lon protease
MPLVVGRGRSIRAAEQAQSSDGLLIVIAQRILTQGDPQEEDLYQVGTLCKIETSAISETGSRQIVVTGIARYRVLDYQLHSVENYLSARGEIIADILSNNTVRHEALFFNLKEMAQEIVELLPGGTEPLTRLIERVDDAAYLTNICAAYLNLSLTQKQDLLETVQIESRMEILLDSMRKEREILSLQKDIRDKMSERLNKAQREALLREQLKTIRTELGDEATENSIDELENKIKESQLPDEAFKQAHEELKRLKNLPTASAEYHVIRTYLEWLSALPWSIKSSSPIDLVRARKILDEDHYGLEEVKKRILQFLAVAKLKNDIHGPILCLVGPPGVGKTSLGQSVARALGRKFIRTSLGGVRDEAEIRGHRRTYVGAMPGRIIQSMKRVGTRNPVMMLDEIDKLRADFHGDPSAAMLEVLDPEQNKTFIDHYIDIPFDLSDVFFITTANVVDNIPPPLKDRMEMIEVHSYTSFEKIQIAKRYLIPKQLTAHGLKADQIVLPDDTIKDIITHYTREAGVRELQRKIASLFRAAAEEVVNQLTQASDAALFPVDLSPQNLRHILGSERYFPESAERIMRPGIATGLAWTSHGGDLLFIEASSLPDGKGQLILTGQLGDIMKESAQIALSLARSSLRPFSQHQFDFGSTDIHIHVPAGAIPKDGPSAGITLLAALASLILSKPLDPGVAMTGEITLRGSILPVGGIKEKVIAAHRAGLTRLLIPKKNQPDLAEVPEEIRNQFSFVLVETIEDVLHHVLSFDTKPWMSQTAAA